MGLGDSVLIRNPGTLLLSGVVGSHAYGLATEDSDVDRLGLYACHTEQLFTLKPPKETVVSTDPDYTVHEAAKYCRLALQCNPTVLELLWLEKYETLTPLGEQLIKIRLAFLSAPRVRNAYLGYATQQFRRLRDRGDGSFSADTRKRTAKHARHLARLLRQGWGLYRYGSLRLQVADPNFYHAFGEQVASGDLELAERTLGEYEHYFDMNKSPLPDKPDTYAVDWWLTQVRLTHLTATLPREEPDDSAIL